MLLAVPAGLLADVLELALRREAIEHVRATGWAWRLRRWDVAVVSLPFLGRVRARRLIVVTEAAPTVAFDALLGAVRRARRCGAWSG